MHPKRYFASLKATTMSSYTCFGYWGHFNIFEKLSLTLVRVFSAIWVVMALWSKRSGHSVRCRDPTPPIPDLSEKMIAQMQWLTLGEWDFLLDNSQKLAMDSQIADKKNSWNKVQITQSLTSTLDFAPRRCFPSLEAILHTVRHLKNSGILNSCSLTLQPEKQKITYNVQLPVLYPMRSHL